MKKILLMAVLSICLALGVLCAPVYKYEDTKTIADSVSLTKVNAFYTDKNITYSYIKADLTDPDVDLSLLKSRDGVDALKTVSELAGENDNTLAAVNGDFFSLFSGNKGFSLGIEKSNDELLASPINPATMATIAYDGDNVLMSYLEFHIMVVAPNWQYKEVRHLNKHTTYYGDILMYTSDFNGGMSPAPGGEVVEMVVEDGVVKEFRKNMPPVKIPENGCVLVVSEGVTNFLSSNFKVGDNVKFDYYITPSLDDFKTAFGGGAVIVQNGVDVGTVGNYSHEVAGNNPRTAIGIDKNGTTLYLVAVDGRSSTSAGMRMSHLAKLMIELGCYTAVNLDGGGSTNMVASTLFESSLHTVNNPTENRKVINAVGITLNENEKNAVPFGVEVVVDKQYALTGQPVEIKAKVYDANKRPMDNLDADIVLACDKGSIKDNALVSNVGGRVNVTATYGEFSSTCYVDIIDSFCGIYAKDNINLVKGRSQPLEIYVFDGRGRFVRADDFSLFEISSSRPDVAVFENGKIKAVGNGSAQIQIKKDGAVKYVSVSVGKYDSSYYNGFENENASFVSYPKDVKGNFAVTDEISFSGLYSGKLSFNFIDNEEDEKDVSKAVYCALNNPVKLSDSCNAVYINAYAGKTFNHTLRAQFTDGKGKLAIVPFEGEIEKGKWRGLCANIPEDMARPLTLTRVYVLYTPGEIKDSGELFLDDLSFETCFDYKSDETVSDVYIHDIFNSNVTSTLRIGAIPSAENVTPLTSYAEARIRKYVTSYGSGAFVGEGAKSSISYDENSIYIRVDTSKGGIRKTDGEQWTSIVSALGNMKQQNVFVLCDGDVFGNDEFENSVIKDVFAESSKNVFVIMCGDSANYRNIKGVHYFTLDNTPETSFFGMESKCESVVEFYFGDKVTFEFKKI